jgi:hypothetical protein
MYILLDLCIKLKEVKNIKLTEQSSVRTPSHTINRNSWIFDKTGLKWSCHNYFYSVSAELQDSGFGTIFHQEHQQIKSRKDNLKWHRTSTQIPNFEVP